MRDRLARLAGWDPPTWLLGAAVALLGWNVAMNPPAPGLDSSWNAGLAMAARDGMQFGTEIVFSYGPLGFLQGQGVWFGDLGLLAFLHAAGLFLAFCTGIVWALRRRLPALAALLVAFAIVAVLPLFEQALLVAVLASAWLLDGERSPRAVNLFLVGAASFAALEALVKLSTGPVIAAVFLFALIGAGARRAQLAAYLGLFAAELLLLWLLSGQSLGAVPDFVANTAQVVSGYSTAMLRDLDEPAWKVALATLAALLLSLATVAAAAWIGREGAPRRRWWAVGIFALSAFMLFKQGVVRTDAGHLSLYFSSACVLWLALPWRDWRPLLAGVAAIALIAVPVRPPGLPTNLDALANVRLAAEQVPHLLSAGERDELSAEGRAGMRSVYRLDPAARRALRGRTVAVEPWEVGVAWAYGMRWDPLPVFQSYTAYTAELDRLNAEALAAPSGPERILRANQLLVFPEFETPGIDGRYLGWDPPEQALAALCHFVPVHTTERWQVLARTADRCGPPRRLGAVEAAAGEPVPVPEPGPGEVVFARIHGAAVGGLERIASFLFHARVREIVVDDSRTYRLVPETAADGLLMRSGPGVEPEAPQFAQIPQAETVAVRGIGGTLRYEFFAMRVR